MDSLAERVALDNVQRMTSAFMEAAGAQAAANRAASQQLKS
jgi:hypothetical protein